MRNVIESELIYGLTGPRSLLHFHSNRIVPKLDSSHSSTSSFSPLSHFDETGSYHSSISKILKSLSYLTWFSVLICIFFAIITILRGSCRRVIWNSSLPVATLHFKWLLHCKEPYCVGKGVTYLKCSFNSINDLQNFTLFSVFCATKKVYYLMCATEYDFIHVYEENNTNKYQNIFVWKTIMNMILLNICIEIDMNIFEYSNIRHTWL